MKNNFFTLIYFFFIFLGVFAFSIEINSINNTNNIELVSNIIFAVILIILGGLGLKSIRINYRGGIYTVIGCGLIAIGIYGMSLKIDELLFSETTRLLGSIMSFITFIIIGVVFLSKGHKKHKLMSQKSSIVNEN